MAGQICTVEMREFVPETFRGQISLSEECGSKMSGGYNFTFDNKSFLESLPGTYRVCWCRPDPAAQVACEEAKDFAIPVGFFRVVGPYVIGFECTLGDPCIVGLEGVGLAVTDTLLPTITCGVIAWTVTFGVVQPVAATLNESTGKVLFDFGSPNLETVPEEIQLCWCSAASACEVDDYRSLAVQLRTVCPPGTYSSNTPCAVCPAGFYCPGGELPERLPCPTGSTSLQGATSILECTCLANYFWSAVLSSCLKCSPGLGFLPDEATCVPCSKGTYSPGGLAACEPCPAGRYSDTEQTPSASLALQGSFAFQVVVLSLHGLVRED